MELEFLGIGHPRAPRAASPWFHSRVTDTGVFLTGFPAPHHNLSHSHNFSCPQQEIVRKKFLDFTKTKNISIIVLKSLEMDIVGANRAFFMSQNHLI